MQEERSSGLRGQLEDLQFMEILQIVAFSQKTGYLYVEGPYGKGAVVFKGGLIVCAYSWSTIDHLRQIGNGHYPAEQKRAIIQEQIETSLRELAGFGVGADGKQSSRLARSLGFQIGDTQPFAEVLHTARTHRLGPELDTLERCLYSHIGRGRACGCVLVPLIYGREPLLVLYGDNAISGKPLGNIRGLEMVVAQAGMALENTLMQRKLQSLDSKLSVHGSQA